MVDIKLNKKVQFAIVLLLAYTFHTSNWIATGLANIGFPTLKFQQLWFFVLPGLYILVLAFEKNRLKLPLVVLFAIFFSVHYLMENYLYDLYVAPGFEIDLLLRMVLF